MNRDRICRMQGLFLPAAGRQRAGAWEPSVDVYQTRGGWLVKFDLAGIRPEEMSLSASGKRLTVRGERRDAIREEGCKHYRMEISYSRFERAVELPVHIDPKRVRTEYRDGMLLVHVHGEEKR